MADFYFLPNKTAVTCKTADRVSAIVVPLGVRFEVINPLYVMIGEGLSISSLAPSKGRVTRTWRR